MTTKELAAAGLPAEPVDHNPENAQPLEEEGSPAASESRSHEDGEIRTDDEDVGDVDATSEIWSEQGRHDLCLCLLFSENPRLPQT
jgi:hypothetical protein